MSGVLEAFLLTFAGLFPIVNPIEGAPFFLGMTAGVSSAERQVLARKVAINGFGRIGRLVLRARSHHWLSAMPLPSE